jgi:hypothetical protein
VNVDHHGSEAVHVHVIGLFASTGELLVTETLGATLVRDHVANVAEDSFHKESLTLARNPVVVGSFCVHKENDVLACRPIHETQS